MVLLDSEKIVMKWAPTSSKLALSATETVNAGYNRLVFLETESLGDIPVSDAHLCAGDGERRYCGDCVIIELR